MLVCHLDSSAVIWLSCPLLARSRFLLGKTGNWGHSRSWLSVGAAVATTFTRRMNAMTFQLETSLKGPSYPPGRCIAVWWSGPASVPAWRYLQVLMIPTIVQGMLVSDKLPRAMQWAVLWFFFFFFFLSSFHIFEKQVYISFSHTHTHTHK